MTLEEIWMEAAADLGIEVEAPFHLKLLSGATLLARVRLLSFGARNGMLVLDDYSSVERVADELVDEGYGYSVLDEPGPQEAYDREDFIEMLNDWGWSGDEKNRPVWCDT